jgi:hypothetical protein
MRIYVLVRSGKYIPGFILKLQFVHDSDISMTTVGLNYYIGTVRERLLRGKAHYS